jgi:hypothetical protein
VPIVYYEKRKSDIVIEYDPNDFANATLFWSTIKDFLKVQITGHAMRPVFIIIRTCAEIAQVDFLNEMAL